MTKIKVTKHIRRTPDVVYRAWQDPALMRRWFCPKEMTVVEADADFRVGGSFRSKMTGPQGTVTAQGKYTELVPDKKIVFTHSWADEDGPETRVTVDLAAKDGGTELTLTHEGFTSAEAAKGHEEGWASTLDNFIEHLA